MRLAVFSVDQLQSSQVIYILELALRFRASKIITIVVPLFGTPLIAALLAADIAEYITHVCLRKSIRPLYGDRSFFDVFQTSL